MLWGSIKTFKSLEDIGTKNILLHYPLNPSFCEPNMGFKNYMKLTAFI